MNNCPEPELNKLCNFEYAVECKTNATYVPNTIEELQTIVKNAVAKGLRVRAVGKFNNTISSLSFLSFIRLKMLNFQQET
jgi:hypothetical protein